MDGRAGHEGDTLVSRYSLTGTQDGDYRSIPATHKKVTVQGVSFNKIIGGKLAETRMVRDDLGLMRQLGVIPESQFAYPSLTQCRVVKPVQTPVSGRAARGDGHVAGPRRAVLSAVSESNPLMTGSVLPAAK